MKKAFTLAEVLITLGVLGIIGALTLPALFNDTEKNTWVNQMKSGRSILTNGFAQMMALQGANNLTDTELWNNVITTTVSSKNNDVKNELAKYFTIDKLEDNALPTGVNVYDIFGSTSSLLNSTMRIKLANAMTVNMVLYTANANKKSVGECDTIKSNGGNMCNYLANIYLDVNGNKKPNVIGKDIYNFYLGSDGRLFPFGGEDVFQYDNTNAKWKTKCDGKKLKAGCDSRALTARVIEEGYKINY
ncbi:type II secretion system protein [bacterium]|nr:type II secretion system protein [bacterium]